ncbi:hypothetical protein SAMN04488020_103273 [Palleronia marisminoris]|uniref:Coenzyme PQQ synthesis protein B n=1 Tax=Palleronia marisminoris TaxID=315423 RepID=A0A1Y5SF51_9RHOB|nr:hypothetical protein SAMN04488020_103273 [Palleronia marisminoris]SLN36530.1 Coenzyme PQQ synthesis protein B [Palleronia marisminoris]
MFFDGTLWRDDAMIREGLGQTTGARMGHMSMCGREGSIAAHQFVLGRKVYIHMNNTNPVLRGCMPDQVGAWVINRHYYQHSIPMTDAAYMSRVGDPALRRT